MQNYFFGYYFVSNHFFCVYKITKIIELTITGIVCMNIHWIEELIPLISCAIINKLIGIIFPAFPANFLLLLGLHMSHVCTDKKPHFCAPL